MQTTKQSKAKQNRTEQTQVVNVPSIAVPVVRIGPVSPLVLEHQTVNGVASFKDGHRGAQLTIPHGVMQALIAFKN